MQNKLKYLALLLPGLFPLVVFVAVDELASTNWAIVTALASGVLIFIYTWIRHKHADKFILFDTLLLAGFGAVSLLLQDDIFFKLKPGIIQAILVVIIGVSAFSPKNILLTMASRYMPDQKLNNDQLKQLQKQTTMLFWLFLVHTILVFYSAFFMSKEAWAFISGGLFYILAGVWFLAELIRQKLLAGNVEWVPVLNNEGKVIGKATRQQVHNGQKALHPVVHLHVFNSQGQIFVQKRPDNKEIQPGKWDTAVGGHIAFKETPQKALIRESREELNLTLKEPVFLFSYIWESQVEREFVYVFAYTSAETPKINIKELADGKFMTFGEVKKNLGKSFFTPNFEHEFQLLTERIKKR